MAFLEFRVIRWGLRFWKFGAFGLGALGVQGLGAYCRFIRYSGDVRVAFFQGWGLKPFHATLSISGSFLDTREVSQAWVGHRR